MSKLDLVVGYVEGKISPEEFQKHLYSDKELEHVLSKDVRIMPYTKDGNMYLYLIQSDLISPRGGLNSQEALSRFLDMEGVPHTKNEAPDKIFSILLKAQPKWLDIPDFYLKEILPSDMNQKQDDIISYIRNRIGEKFTFLNKPPKWLQSPRWMFTNGHPLKFIGQLDISGIRHDDAQLYVFYDDGSKEFLTLEQSA